MSERNWIKKELNLEFFYEDMQNIFDKRRSLLETIGEAQYQI